MNLFLFSCIVIRACKFDGFIPFFQVYLLGHVSSVQFIPILRHMLVTTNMQSLSLNQGSQIQCICPFYSCKYIMHINSVNFSRYIAIRIYYFNLLLLFPVIHQGIHIQCSFLVFQFLQQCSGHKNYAVSSRRPLFRFDNTSFLTRMEIY